MIAVSEKTLLRRRIPLGQSAWKAPNQGLERSVCCCVARPRPFKRSVVFSQTPVRPISVPTLWISKALTQALMLRGGILMSIGDFLESLSQAILVGIMLAGRLGVLAPTIGLIFGTASQASVFSKHPLNQLIQTNDKYTKLCKPRSSANIIMMMHTFRGKQRDPNPKDNSLVRKETPTYKGFHSTLAALFSYEWAVARVRVPLSATHTYQRFGII